MILKRVYNEALAHASYLIGCPGAGEAVIIDPNRDVEQYIKLAAEEGLRISSIAETHIHADYLSGARELAHRTGGTLYLSDEGPSDWKYQFADDPGVQLVRNGDSFKVGAVRFEVLKTAGHTPEHISFLVTDETASSAPLGILSGDFVFVGDVGRPDLLENAAGITGTAEPGARDLYHSLQKLMKMPEHLLIWPGHGSGSACGKSLGGVPVSALGYERLANWAFQTQSESEFVAKVLDGQPDPPKYFAQMKRLNKEGPALIGAVKVPPRLTGRPAGLTIDTRPSAEYLAAHLPGTLHIPLGGSFVKWSGWLAPYDTDIFLLANSEEEAHEATKLLSLIGLDQVCGWYGPDVLKDETLRKSDQIFFRELGSVGGAPVIVDVRHRDEYEEGHVEGAINLPLGHITERSDEVQHGKKIVAYCSSGTRSAMAVSVFERCGFDDVVTVEDGYQ